MAVSRPLAQLHFRGSRLPLLHQRVQSVRGMGEGLYSLKSLFQSPILFSLLHVLLAVVQSTSIYPHHTITRHNCIQTSCLSSGILSCYQ